jgi:hypothetical protein
MTLGVRTLSFLMILLRCITICWGSNLQTRGFPGLFLGIHYSSWGHGQDPWTRVHKCPIFQRSWQPFPNHCTFFQDTNQSVCAHVIIIYYMGREPLNLYGLRGTRMIKRNSLQNDWINGLESLVEYLDFRNSIPSTELILVCHLQGRNFQTFYLNLQFYAWFGGSLKN